MSSARTQTSFIIEESEAEIIGKVTFYKETTITTLYIQKGRRPSGTFYTVYAQTVDESDAYLKFHGTERADAQKNFRELVASFVASGWKAAYGEELDKALKDYAGTEAV